MDSNELKSPAAKIALHVFFLLLTLCYVFPLLLVISASFTHEDFLTGVGGGYGLIPKGFTLQGYQMCFNNPESIVKGYIITFSQALLNAIGGQVCPALCAYPLSRSNFRFKKPIVMYLLISMLFGANGTASYIINCNVYHLNNTFWIYILPGLGGGCWGIMIYRAFFKGIPESLFESARIDGARELRIFFRIVVPLSVPIIATYAFTGFVGAWNNYMTSMLYIRNSDLYTLQYLLQRIFNENDLLKNLATKGVEMGLKVDNISMPVETMRYAMCVVAAGPMIFLFPFFQKYFQKGLVVGSIKG